MQIFKLYAMRKIALQKGHKTASVFNELFLDGWIRNASRDLYGLTSTLFNSHWSGSSINLINESTAIITGYMYKTKIITPDTVFYRTFPEIGDSNTMHIAFIIKTAHII
jgi:hypothetical protein